jgi:hypothetical protein
MIFSVFFLEREDFAAVFTLEGSADRRGAERAFFLVKVPDPLFQQMAAVKALEHAEDAGVRDLIGFFQIMRTDFKRRE